MKPITTPAPLTPTGILLAAGKGSRFDASGAANKLLAPLQHGAEIGLPVGFVAARRMRNALSRVIVVVDAMSVHRATLTTWFEKAGCEVVAIDTAADGMGSSLAAGIRASLIDVPATAVVKGEPGAGGTERKGPAATAPQSAPASSAQSAESRGWIVGLADMPMIAPATFQEIALALVSADTIVAPVYEGQRGHPVAFGAAHGPALAALTGDTGARALIDALGYTALPTGDAGVLRDIDTPADL